MILRIAFDLPHRGLFDYFGIEGQPAPKPGTRVLAKLGNAKRIGVVMEVADSSKIPLMKIKAIEAVLDKGDPIMPDEIVALVKSASYATLIPVGKLAFAALPPKIRRTAKSVDLPLPPPRGETGASSVELKGQQKTALNDLLADKGVFAPHLVSGFPGTGKSEVVLEAVSATVRSGRTCLMLVPEIHSLNIWATKVAERVPGVNVVQLHGEMKATERLAAWWNAKHGACHVVIGTRSAVFAPLPDMGLVCVVNENSSLFRAEQGLVYSARDLAAGRAMQASCPLLMSSATPSLELRHAAHKQKLKLTMLSRSEDASRPKVQIVDIANRRLFGSVSGEMENALRQELQRGGMSAVLINQRGHGGGLFCPDCRQLLRCRRCSSPLVQDTEESCSCRRCGLARDLPKSCAACGKAGLAIMRPGSVRVAEALATRLPEARILRVDAQTDQDEISRRLAAKDVDIIVGTKLLLGMNLTLGTCGVSDADAILYSRTFRAAEHLLDTLVQLTAKGSDVNLVVQTRFKSHHLFEALRRGSYDTFAFAELNERKSAGLPPYRRQALLQITGGNPDQISMAIGAAKALGRECLPKSVSLLEPAPSLPAKGGAQRMQLLVSAPSRSLLLESVHRWIEHVEEYPLPSSASWDIVMDPEEW